MGSTLGWLMAAFAGSPSTTIFLRMAILTVVAVLHIYSASAGSAGGEKPRLRTHIGLSPTAAEFRPSGAPLPMPPNMPNDELMGKFFQSEAGRMQSDKQRRVWENAVKDICDLLRTSLQVEVDKLTCIIYGSLAMKVAVTGSSDIDAVILLTGNYDREALKKNIFEILVKASKGKSAINVNKDDLWRGRFAQTLKMGYRLRSGVQLDIDLALAVLHNLDRLPSPLDDFLLDDARIFAALKFPAEGDNTIPHDFYAVNAVRNTKLILKLVDKVGCLPQFTLGLYGIRRWAKKLKIDSHIHGYVPGIAWTLMFAKTVQLHCQGKNKPTAAELIVHFFRDYSQREWLSPSHIALFSKLTVRRKDKWGQAMNPTFPSVFNTMKGPVILEGGEPFETTMTESPPELVKNMVWEYSVLEPLAIISPAIPQQNTVFNVISTTRPYISEYIQKTANLFDASKSISPSFANVDKKDGSITGMPFLNMEPNFIASHYHYHVVVSRSETKELQKVVDPFIDSQIHLILQHMSKEQSLANIAWLHAYAQRLDFPTTLGSFLLKKEREKTRIEAALSSYWLIGVRYDTSVTSSDLRVSVRKTVAFINNRLKSYPFTVPGDSSLMVVYYNVVSDYEALEKILPEHLKSELVAAHKPSMKHHIPNNGKPLLERNFDADHLLEQVQGPIMKLAILTVHSMPKDEKMGEARASRIDSVLAAAKEDYDQLSLIVTNLQSGKRKDDILPFDKELELSEAEDALRELSQWMKKAARYSELYKVFPHLKAALDNAKEAIDGANPAKLTPAKIKASLEGIYAQAQNLHDGYVAYKEKNMFAAEWPAKQDKKLLEAYDAIGPLLEPAEELLKHVISEWENAPKIIADFKAAIQANIGKPPSNWKQIEKRIESQKKRAHGIIARQPRRYYEKVVPLLNALFTRLEGSAALDQHIGALNFLLASAIDGNGIDVPKTAGLVQMQILHSYGNELSAVVLISNKGAAALKTAIDTLKTKLESGKAVSELIGDLLKPVEVFHQRMETLHGTLSEAAGVVAQLSTAWSVIDGAKSGLEMVELSEEILHLHDTHSAIYASAESVHDLLESSKYAEDGLDAGVVAAIKSIVRESQATTAYQKLRETLPKIEELRVDLTNSNPDEYVDENLCISIQDTSKEIREAAQGFTADASVGSEESFSRVVKKLHGVASRKMQEGVLAPLKVHYGKIFEPRLRDSTAEMQDVVDYGKTTFLEMYNEIVNHGTKLVIEQCRKVREKKDGSVALLAMWKLLQPEKVPWSMIYDMFKKMDTALKAAEKLEGEIKSQRKKKPPRLDDPTKESSGSSFVREYKAHSAMLTSFRANEHQPFKEYIEEWAKLMKTEREKRKKAFYSELNCLRDPTECSAKERLSSGPPTIPPFISEANPHEQAAINLSTSTVDNFNTALMAKWSITPRYDEDLKEYRRQTRGSGSRQKQRRKGSSRSEASGSHATETPSTLPLHEQAAKGFQTMLWMHDDLRRSLPDHSRVVFRGSHLEVYSLIPHTEDAESEKATLKEKAVEQHELIKNFFQRAFIRATSPLRKQTLIASNIDGQEESELSYCSGDFAEIMWLARESGGVKGWRLDERFCLRSERFAPAEPQYPNSKERELTDELRRAVELAHIPVDFIDASSEGQQTIEAGELLATIERHHHHHQSPSTGSEGGTTPAGRLRKMLVRVRGLEEALLQQQSDELATELDSPPTPSTTGTEISGSTAVPSDNPTWYQVVLYTPDSLLQALTILRLVAKRYFFLHILGPSSKREQLTSFEAVANALKMGTLRPDELIFIRPYALEEDGEQQQPQRQGGNARGNTPAPKPLTPAQLWSTSVDSENPANRMLAWLYDLLKVARLTPLCTSGEQFASEREAGWLLSNLGRMLLATNGSRSFPVGEDTDALQLFYYLSNQEEVDKFIAWLDAKVDSLNSSGGGDGGNVGHNLSRAYPVSVKIEPNTENLLKQLKAAEAYKNGGGGASTEDEGGFADADGQENNFIVMASLFEISLANYRSYSARQKMTAAGGEEEKKEQNFAGRGFFSVNIWLEIYALIGEDYILGQRIRQFTSEISSANIPLREAVLTSEESLYKCLTDNPLRSTLEKGFDTQSLYEGNVNRKWNGVATKEQGHRSHHAILEMLAKFLTTPETSPHYERLVPAMLVDHAENRGALLPIPKCPPGAVIFRLEIIDEASFSFSSSATSPTSYMLARFALPFGKRSLAQLVNARNMLRDALGYASAEKFFQENNVIRLRDELLIFHPLPPASATKEECKRQGGELVAQMGQAVSDVFFSLAVFRPKYREQESLVPAGMSSLFVDFTKQDKRITYKPVSIHEWIVTSLDDTYFPAHTAGPIRLQMATMPVFKLMSNEAMPKMLMWARTVMEDRLEKELVALSDDYINNNMEELAKTQLVEEILSKQRTMASMQTEPKSAYTSDRQAMKRMLSHLEDNTFHSVVLRNHAGRGTAENDWTHGYMVFYKPTAVGLIFHLLDLACEGPLRIGGIDAQLVFVYFGPEADYEAAAQALVKEQQPFKEYKKQFMPDSKHLRVGFAVVFQGPKKGKQVGKVNTDNKKIKSFHGSSPLIERIRAVEEEYRRAAFSDHPQRVTTLVVEELDRLVKKHLTQFIEYTEDINWLEHKDAVVVHLYANEGETTFTLILTYVAASEKDAGDLRRLWEVHVEKEIIDAQRNPSWKLKPLPKEVGSTWKLMPLPVEDRPTSASWPNSPNFVPTLVHIGYVTITTDGNAMLNMVDQLRPFVTSVLQRKFSKRVAAVRKCGNEGKKLLYSLDDMNGLIANAPEIDVEELEGGEDDG